MGCLASEIDLECAVFAIWDVDLHTLPQLLLPAIVPETQVAVLLSGGLDSSILLAELLERGHAVVPLYVRSHLLWETAEQRAVRGVLGALDSPRLQQLVTLEQPIRDVYQDHWSVSGRAVPASGSADTAVRLPARNALLTLKAGLWCHLNGVPYMALGPLKGSPFRDATRAFFDSVERMFQLAGMSSVRVLAPFAELDKREVMQLGVSLPLDLTFSCIAPRDGRHCGECNKCAERQAAFEVSGRPDRTAYHVVAC